MSTRDLKHGKDIAGKPGSSSRFTNFFTPSDLTRHDDMASASCAIISGQVKRCKKIVRCLEEPGFPARKRQWLPW